MLRGKCAIVTGVGGFLGRALAQHLARSGARVIGLDLPAKVSGLPESAAYLQCDLLDFTSLALVLDEAVKESGDPGNVLVFHLAGQAHVGTCRQDPARAFALNVSATLHVLEACRRSGVKQFIFPSSALVYAAPRELPIAETAATQARNIYAATKLAAETLLEGYAAEYGFCCITARLGNVYGPGGTADSVVSIILRQVQAGGPVALKTLAPVRDFIYRDDVVGGLLALAEHVQAPGSHVYNLASGVPVSILQLAQAACRAKGIAEKISALDSSPGGSSVPVADQLYLSIARLSRDAQWQPAWSLEEGLRQTLNEKTFG